MTDEFRRQGDFCAAPVFCACRCLTELGRREPRRLMCRRACSDGDKRGSTCSAGTGPPRVRPSRLSPARQESHGWSPTTFWPGTHRRTDAVFRTAYQRSGTASPHRVVRRFRKNRADCWRHLLGEPGPAPELAALPRPTQTARAAGRAPVRLFSNRRNGQPSCGTCHTRAGCGVTRGARGLCAERPAKCEEKCTDPRPGWAVRGTVRSLTPSGRLC
jgi:hypothetical protein